MIPVTVIIILIGTLWNAYILRTYQGDALDKYALSLGFAIIICGLILLLIS